MGVERRFTCVAGCGACCRNLRVPLSVAEAIAWTGRGHAVDVLTEALIIATPDAIDNDVARHKLPRAHAGICGALPIAVNVVLAARFPDGPCPNLGPDARCAIYAERPAVCRVYPLEITPHLVFDPGRKNCPPAAWAESGALLIHDGECADPDARERIESARAAQIADAPIKARLCVGLRVRTAGLSSEGFVVHALPSETMRAALIDATLATDAAPGERWVIVGNRGSTIAALAGARGDGALVIDGRIKDDPDSRRSYLGFYPDGE